MFVRLWEAGKIEFFVLFHLVNVVKALKIIWRLCTCWCCFQMITNTNAWSLFPTRWVGQAFPFSAIHHVLSFASRVAIFRGKVPTRQISSYINLHNIGGAPVILVEEDAHTFSYLKVKWSELNWQQQLKCNLHLVTCVLVGDKCVLLLSTLENLRTKSL